MIQQGDTIVDFRDQEWTFDRISKMPKQLDKDGEYSTGRILVKDEFGREREFFPTVFGLVISEEGNLVPKEVL